MGPIDGQGRKSLQTLWQVLRRIVINLDELKQINDREGHLAGDSLIRRTAEALTEAARNEDTVCRLTMHSDGRG
ncbi:diguanylate cyclase domain-containing protein [Metapseudomonas resinovorans]|uniref:diguanylate cyclase domain-containing protein n=1 Tax=Metapseudomonas resinovorans TaxID=53412 RepID=UPI003B434BBE